MTLRQYLLTMLLGTLVAVAVFFLALFQINPQTAGITGFVIFYSSLFLSLIGILSLIGFIWRAWLIKQDEPYFRQVKNSSRHAILLSIFLIAALILQAERYLKWWTALLLIVVFTFLEILLAVGAKQRRG